MLILNEEKYAKTIYDGKNQNEKSEKMADILGHCATLTNAI